MDLINKTFGKLIVLQPTVKNKRHEQLWLCLCECGKQKEIKTFNLTSGKTKSCGCEPKGVKPRILIGERFGRLTVKENVGKDKWRSYIYLCNCDCGNEIKTNARRLINQDTKSCGCLKKETDNNRQGSKNPNYDPNISDSEREMKRNLIAENKEWSKAILQTANYTCLVCNQHGGTDYNAHHLDSYHANPLLRLELTNGVCLCYDCHANFHKKYGYKNNTKNQFGDFLGYWQLK